MAPSAIGEFVVSSTRHPVVLIGFAPLTHSVLGNQEGKVNLDVFIFLTVLGIGASSAVTS
jgi:hypothetical protein